MLSTASFSSTAASLSSSQAASPPPLRLCREHRHGTNQTRFYFVVFPCNNSPIFHSNRIPDIGSTSSSSSNGNSNFSNSNDKPRVSCSSSRATAAAQGPPVSSDECDMCRRHWARVHGSTTASSVDSHPALSPVGDVKDAPWLVMEEVPQEVLQGIAFSSAFAGNSGGPSLLPHRTPGATRLPSPVGEGEEDDETKRLLRHSTGLCRRSRSMGAARNQPQSTGHTSASDGTGGSPPALEGPPWHMRLEEVRAANGLLRYYRIIVAATFPTVVATHTGPMYSMQTRHAAVALVLMCPPSGHHYRLLLGHFDVVRALLHRAMHFAMKTMARFFEFIMSPDAAATIGGQGHQALKRVTAMLEKHHEASDTYEALKAELTCALALRWPIMPQLSSRTCGCLLNTLVAMRKQQQGMEREDTLPAPRTYDHGRSRHSQQQQEEQVPCIDKIMYDALSELCLFSESFTSSLVSGLLSLCGDGYIGGNSSNGGGGGGPYGAYWAQVQAQEEEEAEEQEEEEAGCTGGKHGERTMWGPTGSSPPPRINRLADMPSLPAANGTTTTASGGTATNTRNGATEGREEGFLLSARRRARVILFTRDEALAERLITICSFFFRPDSSSSASPLMARSSTRAAGGPLVDSALQDVYEKAFAARVPCCSTSSVPVQWMAHEYSEEALQDIILPAGCYAPDTTLLLVAPRSFLCERLQLSKRLTSLTVLVGQVDRGVVRVAGVDTPFVSKVESRIAVRPSAAMSALVAEALALYKTSMKNNSSSGDGSIPLAAILEDAARWLCLQVDSWKLAGRYEKGTGQRFASPSNVSRGGGASVQRWWRSLLPLGRESSRGMSLTHNNNIYNIDSSGCSTSAGASETIFVSELEQRVFPGCCSAQSGVSWPLGSARHGSTMRPLEDGEIAAPVQLLSLLSYASS